MILIARVLHPRRLEVYDGLDSDIKIRSARPVGNNSTKKRNNIWIVEETQFERPLDSMGFESEYCDLFIEWSSVSWWVNLVFKILSIYVYTKI